MGHLESFCSYIIDESARDSTAHLNELPVVTSCNSTDILESLSHLPSVRPLKRQKLAVPFRAQCEIDATARLEAQENALVEIEKLLKLTKTEFAGGPHGLQAKWAWSIQSHLSLMIWKGQNTINASEMAAECHGFAAVWGGHQIQSWTRTWISHCKLPVSLTGCHAKAYSLLDDPGIAAELHAYIRSNKWAVDAQKLADFSKEKLILAEAEKYLRETVQDEMPQGLRHYMNLELFPRIHLKVGKGISLATARRWLHREGFWYTSYKKGLYFDGHDRLDVVQYRQDVFLPKMKEYEC